MSGNHCKCFSIAFIIFCCSITACDNRSSKNIQDTPRTNNISTLPTKQTEPSVGAAVMDKSPMDVLYFPVEYPKYKMIGTITTPPIFRVLYSRPQLNGRQIFGSLIKDGEPWRLGANEATEIEFFRDVHIQNVKVSAGKYIMYCVPHANEWTIVFNTDLYSWGLKFNRSKDLYKFNVPLMHDSKPVEVFTIDVQQSDAGADLWIAWDTLKVYLPITF